MDISLSFVLTIVVRLALAAGVAVVGRWLARQARRRMRPIAARAHLTGAMTALLDALSFYGVWTLTIVVMLAVVGFPISSALAAVGVVAIFVGIAFQQSLKDFAAAVIFLLFKPFETGNLIQTCGFTGTVQEIQFFNTVLLQADQKVIILPNAEVQQQGIVNYSKSSILRADLVFSISYADDLRKAKQILQEILAADTRVLADPAAQVVVLELGENSVDIGVRPYVKPDDFWNVQNDLMEAVKLRFDEEGITIPFPQRKVHLVQAV